MQTMLAPFCRMCFCPPFWLEITFYRISLQFKISHHREWFSWIECACYVCACLFSLHFAIFFYFHFHRHSQWNGNWKDLFITTKALSIHLSSRSVSLSRFNGSFVHWTAFEVYICYYSSCRYCSNYLFVHYRKTM